MESERVILVLSLAVIGGLISSSLTTRMKGPQVLGYILAGVILGRHGFGVITAQTVDSLNPLTLIALGVIGFLVGGEIEWPSLKKNASKYSVILLSEGLMSTFLVAASSFLIVYFALGNPLYAFMVAIILGAIASATDPASTMGVIWETKSAGILTTTIIAIIALDDVLAMALYGIASNAAQNFGGREGSFATAFLHFARDIGGAIVLGVLIGMAVVFYLKRKTNSENHIMVVLGAVLFSVGFAQLAKTDLILSSMTAGIVATNLAPQYVRQLLVQLRQLTSPIYILFFVLVGARLSLSNMPYWLWLVVIFYVIGRSGGKILGARIGAKLSKADPVVAKNCGMGLFAQGGVAIGLSIVAGSNLQGIMLTPMLSLGEAIVSIVTATTFLIQLTGPAAVKIALLRAGETNKRRTLEDIMDEASVTVLAEKLFFCNPQTTPVEIIAAFSEYPEIETLAVINEETFSGEITLQNLRGILSQKELWPLIVAEDIMVEKPVVLEPKASLNQALKIMDDVNTEQLCVVERKKFIGYLRRSQIRQFAKNLVLEYPV